MQRFQALHGTFVKFGMAILLFAGLGMAQSAPPGPKKQETIRIGMTQPNAILGPNAQNPSGALRTLFSQYLAGPAVEVVNLDSLVPAQAMFEGRQKECDFILSASLSQKKPKKAGFAFLKSMPALQGMVPAFGTASRTVSSIGTAVVQTVVDATKQLTADVKAKGEVSLDYTLVSVEKGATVLNESQKVQADEDGQDVVTPMVEHATTAIAQQLLSAKSDDSRSNPEERPSPSSGKKRQR